MASKGREYRAIHYQQAEILWLFKHRMESMSHINIWSGEFQVIIKVTETGCALQEGQPVIIIVRTRHKNPSSDFLLGVFYQNSHLLPHFFIISLLRKMIVVWLEVKPFEFSLKEKNQYERKKIIILSVIPLSLFLT